MTVLAGSHGSAQEKSALPADVVKLINALASENAAPPAPVDIKLPRGYDRKKQKAVHRAVSKLKALGPPAFKVLSENWGDERYSLTYSVGINGFSRNATVGEMCRRILFDQIQPYGYWPLGEELPDPDPDPLLRQDNDPVDPRTRPTRPDYPRKFLTDQDTASQWLEEHKHKSLFEIQLMVIDWIIEQESASPNDFTDRERKHMQVMRDELVKSNKPLAPGNYHTDDYDYFR